MTDLIPSATVILLNHRQKAEDFDVLLLRRNSKLATHGGSWVFPGGKLDENDLTIPSKGFYELDGDSQIASAKTAAIREGKEEANVDIHKDGLSLVSRWLTPPTMPKRFDAWFFIAEAESDVVTIDDGEIHDFVWISPSDALRRYSEGKMTLPPPTFVSLTYLSNYRNSQQAIASLSANPIHFKPQLVPVQGGMCSLYEDDIAYQSKDLSVAGGRHRLMMVNGSFEYIKD